jgi:hypothetical protein
MRRLAICLVTLLAACGGSDSGDDDTGDDTGDDSEIDRSKSLDDLTEADAIAICEHQRENQEMYDRPVLLEEALDAEPAAADACKASSAASACITAAADAEHFDCDEPGAALSEIPQDECPAEVTVDEMLDCTEATAAHAAEFSATIDCDSDAAAIEAELDPLEPECEAYGEACPGIEF